MTDHDTARVDSTPAGEQHVLPGAERSDAAAIARRRADAARPRAPQLPCDIGLFSDESRQLDLLELTRKG